MAWAQTSDPGAPPAPAVASAASGTEFGGLVDGYYNFYSPTPIRDASLRTFDSRHNQFALSMANVWLSRAPTADARTGFKLALSFGSASEIIHAREPGRTPYRNIQEAYVAYLAPLGNGLRIEAGVFATSMGVERIEAEDNANYSRGLLFSFAQPWYHSGVRATYVPAAAVSITGAIVNGWNNIVDNNTNKTPGKTLLVSGTVTAASKVSISQSYLFGPPELAATLDDHRHLSDTIVRIGIKPRLSLAAEYTYGTQDLGAVTSVSWSGLAVFARFQASPAVILSPRVEYYRDPDGATTGTAQTLKEVTGTLELTPGGHLRWRIEFRHDRSNQKTFHQSPGIAVDHQTSIGVAWLYSFHTRFH